jgi:hypothetical protein
MSEPIEAHAEEVGTDLVPAAQPSTLFRTDDPVDVLDRATRVAQALKNVIDQQGLVSRIQGREHVRVEGWTTLGSMLGVVPVVVWTRKVDDGWEARVEARTLDGRIVGAAESSCSKAEKTWRSRDDYALRSMAQTRATSKALRGPLGFVVTLAGYEATPAEEMPTDTDGPPELATAPQRKYLKTLITQQRLDAAAVDFLFARVGFQRREDEKVNDAVHRLSKSQCSTLIETLKDGAVPTGESDVPADADGFVHPPDDSTLGDVFHQPGGETR